MYQIKILGKVDKIALNRNLIYGAAIVCVTNHESINCL